jgi:hypothetical protein
MHHRDLPDGEAAIRMQHRTYINGAKRRGLEFNIPVDIFRDLILSKCYYCNGEPKTVIRKRSNNNNVKRSPATGRYNGLDRLNCDKGYTIDNVKPCCATCNYAKLQMTEQEFYEWVERVYNNMKSREMNA